jgi:hypothetical protein
MNRQCQFRVFIYCDMRAVGRNNFSKYMNYVLKTMYKLSIVFRVRFFVLIAYSYLCQHPNLHDWNALQRLFILV